MPKSLAILAVSSFERAAVKGILREPLIDALGQCFRLDQAPIAAPRGKRRGGLQDQKRFFRGLRDLLDDRTEKERLGLHHRSRTDDHEILIGRLLENRFFRIAAHRDDPLDLRLKPQTLNEGAVKRLAELGRDKRLLAVKNRYLSRERLSKLGGDLHGELRIGAAAHGKEDMLAIG